MVGGCDDIGRVPNLIERGLNGDLVGQEHGSAARGSIRLRHLKVKDAAVNVCAIEFDAQARQGQDIEQPVEITLEEAFSGATRLLQREDGSTGEVRIPKGVQTGARVRVSGVGGAGMAGGRAGDLYLKIEVKPHAVFERRGDDLYTKAPVDLYTAVLGGSAQVPTMSGPVVLTIPAETANGKTIRLRGQGMPLLKGDEQRGDLYIEVQVTTPRNLSPHEVELFKQLADLRKTRGV